jgi:uncharacterized protein (DUF488 family)
MYTFIEKLKDVNIKTLVDVRNRPYSQWRPDFNKEALESALKEAGIEYRNKPELGVDSKLRQNLSAKTRKELWKWYDGNVVSKHLDKVMKELDRNRISCPVAFMCAESHPIKCHRHRIAKALEVKGMKGLDL